MAMFEPNPFVFGGTEYMFSLFDKHVKHYVDELQEYNCYLLPGRLPPMQEIINDNKDIVLWIHNPFNQFDPQLLLDFTHPKIKNKIKAVVVVSNYLKALIINELEIEKDKVFVIYNVVEPIQNDITRFQDVPIPKIIYTSSADRGLDVLLKAMPLIPEHFEMNIFCNFYPDLSDLKIQDDERLTFYGATPHKTVLKYLATSHIFAYPCQFDETFCISLGEAISANCLPVHSDQRALVEVGILHGMVYRLGEADHVQQFAEIMIEAIKRIKTNCYDPKDSAKLINERFSLDKFVKSWVNLAKNLKAI